MKKKKQLSLQDKAMLAMKEAVHEVILNTSEPAANLPFGKMEKLSSLPLSRPYESVNKPAPHGVTV